MRLFRFVIIFILISFNSNLYSQIKGHLFIIGGGNRDEYLMKKFVDLAGGIDSKIVIIPMASSEPVETALYQIKELQKLGCKNSGYIICSRETADVDSNMIKLDNVKGVFFSGGDQSRLTKAILGTKFLEKIKKIYRDGGIVGGTSAGAAVMSKVMITGNEKINKDTVNIFTAIQKNNVETIEGFGFFDDVIIDQHFVKRKRHNRLISIVLENPKLVALGIDESTALIVSGGNNFEVMGEGSVVVYDARGAKEIRTDKNGNLGAEDIKLQILLNGDKYKVK